MLEALAKHRRVSYRNVGWVKTTPPAIPGWWTAMLEAFAKHRRVSYRNVGWVKTTPRSSKFTDAC